MRRVRRSKSGDLPFWGFEGDLAGEPAALHWVGAISHNCSIVFQLNYVIKYNGPQCTAAVRLGLLKKRRSERAKRSVNMRTVIAERGAFDEVRAAACRAAVLRSTLPWSRLNLRR